MTSASVSAIIALLLEVESPVAVVDVSPMAPAAGVLRAAAEKGSDNPVQVIGSRVRPPAGVTLTGVGAAGSLRFLRSGDTTCTIYVERASGDLFLCPLDSWGQPSVATAERMLAGADIRSATKIRVADLSAQL